MDVNHQAYFIHIWLNKHHYNAVLFKSTNSVPSRRIYWTKPCSLWTLICTQQVSKAYKTIRSGTSTSINAYITPTYDTAYKKYLRGSLPLE